MIVTADDYGRSAQHNEAILRAFERGLITHTSVMANMPSCEQACEMALERGIPDRVGVHLVLTAGRPLTSAITRCDRFCDNSGAFRRWRSDKPAFRIDPGEAEALAAEWRAQIQRIAGQGIPISHLDSHHHVHNQPAIMRVLVPLAREQRVSRVRIARNCGPGIGPARRIYKLGFNRVLRVYGLAGSRFFGDFTDVAHLARTHDGAAKLAETELMTHPVLDASDRLVDEFWPTTQFEQLVAAITPGRELVGRLPRGFGPQG